MEDVVVIALVIGAIVGMIPLFYALSKQNVGLGIGSFIGVLVAGFLFGLIGAIPVAGIFIYLISKEAQDG